MSKEIKTPRITSNHEDATYDHVLKYTGVFGGVQGLKILIMLVRNKLTARFLHAAGMGLNAVYSKIAESINAATNFGISFSAVREVSAIFEKGTEEEMKQYVKVVRTWCVWTGLLGMLLCVLTAPLLSYIFFDKSLAETPFVMLLSLMVFSLPVEAGECAILKGMRKLKAVACIESVAVVTTLLTTIPIYYFWGIKGVVYSLVLTQIAIASVHLFFSVQIVPYRISPFSKSVFHEGLGLIKIGIPYVLASFAGSLTTLFIFQYIEDHSQIGLFNAGYNLMVTAAGMVFVAVEADYFPRLSSVSHDVVRANKTINQQMDVCLMFIAPMLIAFVLALPVVIPMLFSQEFLDVIPMCMLASFHMFLRAIAIPLEYIALAKGDSHIYLLMELIYDVLIVVLMYLLIGSFGLIGAGIALSLTVVLNIIVVYTLYRLRYGFRFAPRTVRLCLFQLMCLSVVVAICFSENLWLKYGVGVAMFLLSSFVTFRILSKESGVLSKVLHRLRKNDHHGCC